MKLLLFTESYCVPCQAFKPIFEEEKDKYHGVEFLDPVDVAMNRELTRRCNVMSVPTLVLLDKNGLVAGFKSGPVSADDIYNLIMEV